MMLESILNYKKQRLENFYPKTDLDVHRETFFSRKIKSIIDYLSEHKIKKVVVGFSGGADSTLVLLLLVLARRQYKFEIHAVTIVSPNPKETSLEYSYAQSILRSPLFINVIKQKINHSQGENILDSFKEAGITLTDDVIHQSYYQSMYGILFTYAQSVGGITVGTTNSDELSYVGWFGKNSDMVVDLQIISDFHKFEVLYILNEFNFKNLSEPTGDIPGGKIDTEYFDCSYDELSYYSYCKCKNINPGFVLKSVDDLHNKNYHKYQGQTFNPIFLTDPTRYFIYNEEKNINVI